MLTSTCISSGTVNLAPPAWAPLTVEPGLLGLPNPIQAQPLYVSQVSTTPALNNCPNPCNMLIAPTLTDSVYAWNADTGATIWSDCSQTGCTRAALWYDDCGSGSGPSLVGYGGTAGLPFAGIVSTPVVDTSVSPPVVYLTSLCATTTTTVKWWIHQLNLYTGANNVAHQQIYGSATGADGADDLTGSSIAFNAWETMQRAALLQVKVSGTGTPNNLIDVGLGFGNGPVGEITTPYHGWVFGYDGSLTQKFSFVTTAKGWGGGANTDSPACTANCTCSGTACDCGGGSGGCGPGQPSGCIATNYVFAANWCGHAGGVWMSGRGPAANQDSSGNSHAYFGVGNGGFQQRDSTGALLSSIQNWDNSVLDFPLPASGGGSTYQSPSEYFTPYGGASVPLKAPLLGNETGGNPVAKTFEGLSQNDYDMSVSGILLFDDPDSNHRLVTIDKAGYGYLLTQGNLCGSGSGCYPSAGTGGAGGATNDPGNAFSFAANQVQCPDQITDDQNCDRVTSMAFYKDGSPPYLYVWPSYEVLAGLQLSDNSSQAGPGSITATGGTTVTGSGTSFSSYVIPGDMLIAGGCTLPSCPIITAVSSTPQQLTISQNLTVSGASWSYSGYLINPIYDVHPMDSYVQYPGGALTVSSNSGSDAVVWALVNLQNPGPPPGTLMGALYVYDASNLHLLWCSNSTSCTPPSVRTFTNASFALPTVANGYVYIPTAGISAATCGTPAACSGVMVYSGH
jgi:hypothetical protein